MIEQLILDYGYFLVFFGTLLEGEMVMVISGYYSQQGLMSLPIVIIYGFLGVFTIDSYFFMLGYTKGDKLTHKISAKKKESFFRFIKKRETLFIFLLRFLYGFRLISLVSLGAAKVSPKKFFTIYTISCIIWATMFGYGGYLFGRAFGEVAKKVEINFIIVITCLLLLLYTKKLITPYFHGKKL